jgi:hypothetical protein
MRKEMKRKKWPLYLVLIIFMAAAAIFLLNNKTQEESVINKTVLAYSDLFFDYEVTKYESGAEVTGIYSSNKNLTLGVVVDPWNIEFGSIPTGNNTGTRFISLENLKEKESKVSFKVYGNISPFVDFSRNNFILHSNEKTMVEASFYTNSSKIGNYSGEIDVIIKTPKYDFLYFFWND